MGERLNTFRETWGPHLIAFIFGAVLAIGGWEFTRGQETAMYVERVGALVETARETTRQVELLKNTVHTLIVDHTKLQAQVDENTRRPIPPPEQIERNKRFADGLERIEEMLETLATDLKRHIQHAQRQPGSAWYDQ